jgi:hypothetical protein
MKNIALNIAYFWRRCLSFQILHIGWHKCRARLDNQDGIYDMKISRGFCEVIKNPPSMVERGLGFSRLVLADDGNAAGLLPFATFSDFEFHSITFVQ